MAVSFRHDHACCGRAHSSDHDHAYEGAGAGSAGRPFAFASSPRHFERDRPFAIEHIALDLALDFPKKSLRGSASLTLRRIDPGRDRASSSTRWRSPSRRSPSTGSLQSTRMTGGSSSPTCPKGAGAGHARRPLRGDAAEGPVLPRARRARARPSAPGLDAVPGGGRAPHLPVPRQAAREDDDRGARSRCPTGFSVLSNGELAGSQKNAATATETLPLADERAAPELPRHDRRRRVLRLRRSRDARAAPARR